MIYNEITEMGGHITGILARQLLQNAKKQILEPPLFANFEGLDFLI